jgi:hypothetical protein
MFEYEISIMSCRATKLYVLIFIESKNQGDVNKKRRLNCITQRNSLSSAQDKVAQVKNMLMPSSLDKDEKRLKEESSC